MTLHDFYILLIYVTSSITTVEGHGQALTAATVYQRGVLRSEWGDGTEDLTIHYMQYS